LIKINIDIGLSKRSFHEWTWHLFLKGNQSGHPMGFALNKKPNCLTSLHDNMAQSPQARLFYCIAMDQMIQYIQLMKGLFHTLPWDRI